MTEKTKEFIIKKWMPFEKTRSIIHKLKLKNTREYRLWWYNNKVEGIPFNPNRTYKNNGWISWGNFLGTNRVSNSNKKYLEFKIARAFIHKLKLKSQTEWNEYRKSGKRPDNIPSNPYKVYKKQFISFGDWLGTNSVAYKYKLFLKFKESKKFVIKLKFKSQTEWREYCKSGKKPDNIPSAPNKFYKNSGWISWGDFLGTNRIADQNKIYLIFKDARTFVHLLNYTSNLEWREYCKSGKKPDNIPSSPNNTYKNSGWISWSDFLGTKLGFNGKYLSFKDARNFVHKLKLKSYEDFVKFYKSKGRPYNIPTAPDREYKNSGWSGWADFLGILGTGNHSWTNKALIAYLEQAKDYIKFCSAAQLLTIIESNGIFNYITKEKLKKIQETEPGSIERETIISGFIVELKTKKDESAIQNNELSEEITETELKEILNEDDKSISDTTETQISKLKALDNNVITASLDDERIQFLIKDSVNNIWYDVLNHKFNFTKFKEIGEFNTKIPNIIKNIFIKEYEYVVNIKYPKGWKYRHEPFLMQKLISYRLSTEMRYGNFSDVGTGKSIGAIFAGRYVDAKNTLIITFNSTIGHEDKRGWAKEIKDSFPNSKIYTKINKYIKFQDGCYNYLILNYETFQQKGAANYVIDLLEKNKFDYVVLDEIQAIKQRDKKAESARREIISGLIDKVKTKNQDYYLMAMSATPVINDLTEAKSIIELITRRKLDDVDTRATIPNCIELFRRLTNHGIRYKNPDGKILKNGKHTIIEINGDDLYDEAEMIDKNDVISKEVLVLQKKLDVISPLINSSKGKTVIYIHYVEKLEKMVYDYVTNLGFKVGVYTGGIDKFERDDVIYDFINSNKYDVLLGSRPIATGVDGLQFVSDLGIVLSLPWTSAESKQFDGRLDRTGSNFIETGVEIIIPLVSINGKEKFFNWDRHRYDMITYKATIADAAIDGVVPYVLMPPRKDFETKATERLDEWIERLKDGNIFTADREELFTELYPEISNEETRRQRILSDLSEMNKKWSLSNSKTINKRLNKNSKEWNTYHSLYSESRKTWAEVPFMEIAKKIKRRPRCIIGDFGCGENVLSKEIKNKVYAFDHIAIDDSVIACDMIKTPLEDSILDIAVFSLSLMGVNYKDYLKEAYRTLKPGGSIFICEPASKWKDKEEKLINTLEEIGFRCFPIVKNTDKFIYLDAIKY